MRRKDEDKKRCIKDAVVKLILQEGFHGTSISKIANLAGVSPATVYIYYENKENMLQDIYAEYSEEIFDQLLDQLTPDMSGSQILEQLIRNYYHYIQDHREVFSFIEQFTSCPSLSCSAHERKGIASVRLLLENMKEKHMIKDYDTTILLSFIFYPVKSIAADPGKKNSDQMNMLQEMIHIIQEALLL